MCQTSNPRKDQNTTSYLESLKEYDIDEMIEEEKVFREIFYTANMDIKTLEQAKRIGNKKAQEMQPFIQGEPYFQPFKNFDLWLRFNSQSPQEERNVKLLLNMPMIPRRYHKLVKLEQQNLI